VVNKKINKKDSSREIVITKELNFDKEMEWIAPIKENEEIKTLKKKKKN
jgi:hypothetical protein